MVLFKCDVLTHLAYVISTLHSTMVLFKYEYRVLVSSYEYLYIPLWFYSNTTPVTQRTMTYLLYIPLWFYSNEDYKSNSEYNAALYIPLWFYSNFSLSIMIQRKYRLYIPLWFYSNQDLAHHKLNQNNFTFHYGSIQILGFIAQLFPK